jgi:hypothetical protein
LPQPRPIRRDYILGYGESDQEEAVREGSKILRIKGQFLHSIVYLFDLSYSSDDLPTDPIDKVRSVFGRLLENYMEALECAWKRARPKYATPESVEEAFWRTLIADTDSGGTKLSKGQRTDRGNL